MHRFEVAEPTTLEEACRLLQEAGPEGKLVAGGTALLLFIREGIFTPRLLIALRRIQGLDAVAPEDGGLRVGALATHARLERDPRVRARSPALVAALHAVGNIRIRHVGTLGGNLCHADPHCDPPPALIAHGAEAWVVSPRGGRTVPVEALCRGYYETALDPDEVLAEVRLPPPWPGERSAYLRMAALSATDWPCAAVAAVLSLDGGICREARVAIGAVGTRSCRAPGAEAVLRGARLTEAAMEEAARRGAEEAEVTGEPRASDWYKRELLRVLIGRALRQAGAGR